ncbi:hypothetical protein HI914_04216 [Erysiphe necator]|uniref:Uncharacterized protein n=1 Tax=Uncinula necator TaxID=52586 RepID=A0A0B1P4B6_UNCNE|nr:hypothetical protein HI914_04216 [Erysiphe necator]KHJ31514.1 hypothetical protein EV44_g3789 [Erysiphe necator]
MLKPQALSSNTTMSWKTSSVLEIWESKGASKFLEKVRCQIDAEKPAEGFSISALISFYRDSYGGWIRQPVCTLPIFLAEEL